MTGDARVLVCGSRTFSDYTLMCETLDEHAAGASVIINGGMAGADALSSFYAYECKINTICVGAQWGTHGSAAGPRRNQRMLDAHHPSLVVAFHDKPREQSRGTAHMVKIAREAGVPVMEIGP